MEIDRLVDECYEEAKAIIGTHKRELEVLKNKLIEEEIVDGEWVYELVCGTCKVRRTSDLDSLDFD